MEEDYNIGVEEWGYPKIHFLGKHWIRVTQGWFFPEICEGESAWYIDYYFDKEGNCRVELDGNWIHFDFWTPLKDYEMGFCSGTIGENFKIPKEVP